MTTEINFLDKNFYWPSPDGLGYMMCYVGVSHPGGWYQCYTMLRRIGFFLHESDLLKTFHGPPESFRILEITDKTKRMQAEEERRQREQKAQKN